MESIQLAQSVSSSPAGTSTGPHPLLETVFQAFERAGVRWCLLRGEAELAAPAGDVDLLVAHADLASARRALAALEFAPLPSWGRGSHVFYLAYHAPTARWIKLDIVTELAYGRWCNLKTRAEEGCLARRRRSGTVCTLAPDDAFWTLLLHCMLDKGIFAPHHAARLRELAEAARADSPLARQVERAYAASGCAADLLAAARSGDWAGLSRDAARLAEGWARRAPLATRLRAAMQRGLRLFEKPAIVLQRRGMSVALLGPDGAGKSTLAAGLQSSFYFPVQQVYMGLWQRGPAGQAGPRIPGLDIALRPLKIWRRYLTALSHQALGRLVIFDRYTYDALLPPRGPLAWLKRRYFWLLAHACPAPDMVFVLDAPGALMYARKGEFDPAHLEAERQQFLALRSRIPGLQVVDVTRGEETVRADVVERIWRRYLDRLRV